MPDSTRDVACGDLPAEKPADPTGATGGFGPRGCTRPAHLRAPACVRLRDGRRAHGDSCRRPALPRVELPVQRLRPRQPAAHRRRRRGDRDRGPTPSTVTTTARSARSRCSVPHSNVGVQVLDADGELVYDEASMRKHMQTAIEQGGAALPSIQRDRRDDPQAQRPGRDRADHARQGAGRHRPRLGLRAAAALMTDRDMRFRRGSFMGLAIAAIAAIVLASIAGAIYAGRLVRADRADHGDCARRLRGGDRDARTGMQGDDEIGFLGKTFDEMADSIEADREMERRLTADVAHELRTPLQAIQATVEAMQDGVLARRRRASRHRPRRDRAPRPPRRRHPRAHAPRARLARVPLRAHRPRRPGPLGARRARRAARGLRRDVRVRASPTACS